MKTKIKMQYQIAVRMILIVSLLSVFSITAFSWSDDGQLTQTVDGCGTLSTANAVYIQTANLSNLSACIMIAANNITYNGNGYEINFSSTAQGDAIYVPGYNYSKIRNVIITQVNQSIQSTGIRLTNSHNNTLTNITTTNCGYAGIWLAVGSGNLFQNIISSNNTGVIGILLDNAPNYNNQIINATTASNRWGIYLSASSDNNITNVSGSGNTWSLIYVSGSNNNTFSSITAFSNAAGFDFEDNSRNNQLIDSNLSLSTGKGLVMGGCSNNHIINTNIQDNGDYGVYFTSVANSSILNGIIINNTKGIVIADSSAENNLTNITSSANIAEGIYLTGSSYNNLTNITANENGLYGIYLKTSSNNYVSYAMLVNNTGYGIILDTSATNNFLTNITSVENHDNGIYFQVNSNYNTVTDAIANLNVNGISFLTSSYNNVTRITANNNTNIGLLLWQSTNDNITNVEVIGNQNMGIYSMSGINNTLLNITISSNTNNGLLFEDSDNSYFTNLNMTGNPGGLSISGEINYPSYLNDYGEIRWIDASPSGFLYDVTVSEDLSFPGTILIDNNTAYINTSALSGKIISAANITLNGIGDRGFINATIIKDGHNCFDCYNFTSLTAETVIFNVTTLGNYSIGEALNETQIYECQTLSLPNWIYLLQGNVNSSETCFTIEADNVTLEGNGFSINYSSPSGSNYGISINAYNNATIKNLTIFSDSCSGECYGIFLQSSSNNTLQNINAHNNFRGIIISASSNNQLTDISTNNNTHGVTLTSTSNNNNLTDITADENSMYGVLIPSSSFNTLTDINASFNGQSGVYLETSTNNNLSIINASSNGDMGIGFTSNSINNFMEAATAELNNYGIILDTSNSNVLINITANSNIGYHGILLGSSSYNNLTDIVANSNNQNGIAIEYGDNNTLVNVTANNNSQYGIYLTSSTNNVFDNILSAFNGIHGMSLNSNSNNNILNNSNLSLNTGKGLSISGGANNHMLNVNISNNGDYGIYFSSVVNSSIVNAQIISNDKGIVFSDSSTGNNLTLIASSSNVGEGIYITTNSDNNVLSDIAASSNGNYDLALLTSYDNNIYDAVMATIYYELAEGTNNLTNITYSSIDFASSGTLNRLWYLDLYIVDDSGPLQDANITVWDKDGNLVFSELTDVNGRITQQELPSYAQTSAGDFSYYYPYSMNVSLGGDVIYSNSTIDLTANVWINIDTVPPQIQLISPSEGQNIIGSDINFIWNATDNSADVNPICDLYVDDILVSATITSVNSILTTQSYSVNTYGNHNWSVTCTDDNDNQNSSDYIYFSNEPAFMIVDSPQEIERTGDDTVDFILSGTKNLSWCGYDLDSAGNVSMTMTNATLYQDSLSGLDDGYHSVTFYCNDSSNIFATQTVGFITGDLSRNISECGTLDLAYGIYTLNQSIAISGNSCFVIAANNIMLNGNGFAIVGDSEGLDVEDGIVIDGYNNTNLQDVLVSGFTKGLLVNNTRSTNITGCNFSQNGPDNDNINTNDGFNIYLSNSKNFSIIDTIISEPNESLTSGEACPSFYTLKQSAFKDYYSFRGDFLIGAESHLKERADYNDISYADIIDGKLKIKVSEITKDETTYLDMVYLRSDGDKIILPASIGNADLGLINYSDNNYLVVQRGESFEFEFNVPYNFSKLEFVAEGYYLSSKKTHNTAYGLYIKNSTYGVIQNVFGFGGYTDHSELSQYAIYLLGSSNNTIDNVTISDWKSGISLKYDTQGSDYNTIKNSNISIPGYYDGGNGIVIGYDTSCTFNNITNNTIVTTSYSAHGISSYGTNNSFFSNTISTYGNEAYGIYLDFTVPGWADISFNNVTTHGTWTAIIKSNGENNGSITSNTLTALADDTIGIYTYLGNMNISHNSIETYGAWNGNADAIYGMDIMYGICTIDHNNITTRGLYAGGIYLAGAPSYISNNIINTSGESGHGIMFSTNNDNSSIDSNRVYAYGPSSYALNIGSATNSNFTNNTMSINASSIYAITEAGRNNFFSQNIVSAPNGYGIDISTVTTEDVFKDSIFNTSSYDIMYEVATAGFYNNFTNVTYDTISFANSDVYLNRFWYFDISLSNYSNTAIENANVTMWDKDGILIFSEITNSSGRIAQKEIISYIQASATNFTYYSPFSINITTAGEALVYSNDNINLSTNIFLNAKADTVPPNLNVVFPEENYSFAGKNLRIYWNATDNNQANMTCDLYLDDALAKENLVSISGALSSTLTSTSSYGAHHWYLICADESGNKNTSSTRNFSNQLSFISTKPYKDEWFDTYSVQINLTGSRALDWCGYATDLGQTVAMNEVNLTYFNSSTANLTEGSHTLSISCNDTTNLFAKEDFQILVDTTTPKIYFASSTPENNTISAGTSSFTATVSTDDVAQTYVLLDYNIGLSTPLKVWTRFEELTAQSNPKDNSTYPICWAKSGDASQVKSYWSNGFYFDGDGDWIRSTANCGNGAPTDAYDSYSFSLWVRLDSLPSQNYSEIFGRTADNFTYSHLGTFGLLTNQSGSLFYHEGPTTLLDLDYQLETGIWYHLAFVRSKDNSDQLYVNGELITTESDSSLTISSPFKGYFTVGRWSSTPGQEYYLNGTVDDIILSTNVFSSGDVSSLYNATNFSRTLGGEGRTYYKANIIDRVGRLNETERRVYTYDSGTSYVWQVNEPSSYDVDPAKPVTITVDVFDYGDIDTVNLLVYTSENCPWCNEPIAETIPLIVNNSIPSQSGTLKRYIGNFTPASDNDVSYYYGIFSNDTFGREQTDGWWYMYSSWDCGWDYQATDFNSIAPGFNGENREIGNITIRNRDDPEYPGGCGNPLIFQLTHNLPIGRIYFNNVASNKYVNYYDVPTSLGVNATYTISINATFLSEVTQEAISFTIRELARGSTQTSTGYLTSSLGGPYLFDAISIFPETIYLTKSNHSLKGYVRNLAGDSTENNTAYNVQLNWSLPNSFLALSGIENASFYSLTNNYINYNNMNITFNATNLPSLSPGMVRILLNASGLDTDGNPILFAGNTYILGAEVNVSLLCYNVNDSICVPACGYLLDPDCEEPEPVVINDTVERSSGGGSGSGAAAPPGLFDSLSTDTKNKLLQTNELIELVSGKDTSFTLNLSNPFNSTLENFSVNVSGYLSQYISISQYPSSLKPNESIQLKINITAPTYFTKGTYNLNFMIQGIIIEKKITISNKTIITINKLEHNKTVTLEIHSISKEDASSLITDSNSLISTLGKEGFYTRKLTEKLDQEHELLKNRDYEGIEALNQIIATEAKKARDSGIILAELKVKIDLANKRGMKIQDSIRLYGMAIAALNRGDFDTALIRSEEAKLTFALETKGWFSIYWYVYDNWQTLLILTLSSLFIAIILFYTFKVSFLKARLKNLKKEETIILGLMKAAQKECFHDKKMSMGEYDEAMLSYEDKLTKTVQKIVYTETSLSHVFSLRKKHLKLIDERKKIIDLIKCTQHDYLNEKIIDARVYGRKMKSYTGRLAEVEEELAVREAMIELRNETSIWRKHTIKTENKPTIDDID